MNRLFISLSLVFAVSLFTGDWLPTATHNTLKSGLAADVVSLAAERVIYGDLPDEQVAPSGSTYQLSEYRAPIACERPCAAITELSRATKSIRAPPYSHA